MELIIKPIEETSVTFEQYYDFIQDAYKERVSQGIYFPCTQQTIQEMKADIVSYHGRIFLAFDSVMSGTNGGGERKKILASVTVAFHKSRLKGKYAVFHLMGTSAVCKHSGIGSKMLNYMVDYAAKQGCSCVLLGTSTKATSAVKFYLKNNFNIVSIGRRPKNNYDSYGFRFQIKHPSLYDLGLFRKFRYQLTLIIRFKKLIYKPDK